VLITVDAANLWRAQHEGLIGSWKPLTLRARTIMRSTERVGPGDVTTYESLGDPRWKGKLCLRSGTSEYNLSFVADRLAKDGRAATEQMLRRWMANDPKIFGSDTDVLEAIKDGNCDVGLTNSYYLGRELADDPNFPVAPVWADQNGRGTQVNLSGLGVVHWSNQAEKARELVEFLREPSQQEIFVENNHEYPAVAGVKPDPVMARFGTFKRDVIDVAAAGPLLDDALKLMDQVGWD
jgi:iron(III) transport system substrate-binding protein